MIALGDELCSGSEELRYGRLLTKKWWSTRIDLGLISLAEFWFVGDENKEI